MKDILKQFRPFDYILISLAVFLSFTPAIVTSLFYVSASPESQLVAIIKIDGEVVDQLPLGKSIEKTYYPHEGQYNIVQIEGKSVRVKEDNSPDQIAVNTGWIHKNGEILVCLPHQFIIEIHDKGNSDTGDEDELILPI